MQLTQSDADRFWSKVVMLGVKDCWQWVGSAPMGFGYGRFCFAGVRNLAHRVSYFLANGAFDDELCVLHKCDNPICVNPNHLFLGTQADNMRDMQNKGRARYGTSSGEKCGAAKIDRKTAAAIKYADGTQKEIGLRFGISKSQVGNIRSGKSWQLDTS